MSWQKPRPKPQNLQQVSSKNRQRRHNSSSSTSSSIMNASSKGATALDGAELTAKSLNYTASRKLFCVKTGEEIPRGTYQRRGHFITCCGGNCRQPEVADGGCADASCNCAEGWKIDDAPEPPHGEETQHAIRRAWKVPLARVRRSLLSHRK